jgi:hypothetical protein
MNQLNFLHKSTTTPLNDKRKTKGGFWSLDTNRTFFVHTLNHNVGYYIQFQVTVLLCG